MIHVHAVAAKNIKNAADNEWIGNILLWGGHPAIKN